MWLFFRPILQANTFLCIMTPLLLGTNLGASNQWIIASSKNKIKIDLSDLFYRPYHYGFNPFMLVQLPFYMLDFFNVYEFGWLSQELSKVVYQFPCQKIGEVPLL